MNTSSCVVFSKKPIKNYPLLNKSDRMQIKRSTRNIIRLDNAHVETWKKLLRIWHKYNWPVYF